MIMCKLYGAIFPIDKALFIINSKTVDFLVDGFSEYDVWLEKATKRDREILQKMLEDLPGSERLDVLVDIETLIRTTVKAGPNGFLDIDHIIQARWQEAVGKNKPADQENN